MKISFPSVCDTADWNCVTPLDKEGGQGDNACLAIRCNIPHTLEILLDYPTFSSSALLLVQLKSKDESSEFGCSKSTGIVTNRQLASNYRPLRIHT